CGPPLTGSVGLLTVTAGVGHHRSRGRGMSNRAQATGTTIEDGARVTMTEWRCAPGAETGWHRHGLDYVVMYRTAAHLAVETRDGVVSVDLAEGTAYFRKAGAEHNSINAGSKEVVCLEVELK